MDFKEFFFSCEVLLILLIHDLSYDLITSGQKTKKAIFLHNPNMQALVFRLRC